VAEPSTLEGGEQEPMTITTRKRLNAMDASVIWRSFLLAP
jgi:hypothetical protein